MKNVKSKLSFSHWGETITIEKEYSDITIDEFFEMVRNVALGAGFHHNNVKEYLDL